MKQAKIQALSANTIISIFSLKTVMQFLLSFTLYQPKGESLKFSTHKVNYWKLLQKCTINITVDIGRLRSSSFTKKQVVSMNYYHVDWDAHQAKVQSHYLKKAQDPEGTTSPYCPCLTSPRASPHPAHSPHKYNFGESKWLWVFRKPHKNQSCNWIYCCDYRW